MTTSSALPLPLRSASTAGARTRGFTLIELMITVAIVAVLAGLAYPSYTSYIKRGQRSNAQQALNEAAQFMQRYYSANNAYDRALGDTAKATNSDDTRLPANLRQSPKEGTKAYDISVSTDRYTYTLTATRTTGGPMADDVCGNFTLTHTGLKGLASAATGQTVATCWR